MVPARSEPDSRGVQRSGGGLRRDRETLIEELPYFYGGVAGRRRDREREREATEKERKGERYLYGNKEETGDSPTPPLIRRIINS
ncbi:hypothetical protein B296_00048136 [Ensete ventricosum]|uniref:Uncharacterized protein n=1 Tax=Ensete ventricosum TaxID=4639 RepID=A0A426YW20_ENSVE|nr:hypothetical protein B296_00048136 [Ensete ventricosum]